MSEKKPEDLTPDMGVPNETVAKMGKDLRNDVPAGLATIPKGMNATALARATAGEIAPNRLEYHCGACGWSGTIEFEPEEIEALGGNIRDYSGPCPNPVTRCGCMTLTPKDVYWGKDFPSMSAMAQKGKREDARINAEELVNAVVEKVGPMMGGSMPKPTIEDPEDSSNRSDLPDEADASKLKPR